MGVMPRFLVTCTLCADASARTASHPPAWARYSVEVTTKRPYERPVVQPALVCRAHLEELRAREQRGEISLRVLPDEGPPLEGDPCNPNC